MLQVGSLQLYSKSLWVYFKDFDQRFTWQRTAFYMAYKNDAILIRIHVTGCLCKLLGNICSVKPNFSDVTLVWLLKLTINTFFLALSTQQQVLTTISRKLPREPFFTYYKSIIKALDKGEKFAQSYECWHQNGYSATFIADFELILLFSKVFTADFGKTLVS